MKTKNVVSYIYNFYNRDDGDGDPITIDINGYKVVLGINVILMPGVTVKPNQKATGKPTIVGSNSFIGKNATLLEGTELPPRSVVEGEMVQSPSLAPKAMLVGDDFGRKGEHNQCVAHLLSKGQLHHASLILNKKEQTDNAIQMLNEHPEWRERVSLHFNITEGYTLIGDPDFYYSVNLPDSLGRRINAPKASFYLSKKDKQTLIDELKAQINYYKSLGLKPKYFDAHGNVHFKWPIAKAITPILKEAGFEYVRIPRDNKTHPLYDFFFKRRVTRLYRKNFKAVDAFIYATDIMDSNFAQYNGKTIEIMTHPFMKDGVYINRRDVGYEALFAYLKAIGATLL